MKLDYHEVSMLSNISMPIEKALEKLDVFRNMAADKGHFNAVGHLDRAIASIADGIANISNVVNGKIED